MPDENTPSTPEVALGPDIAVPDDLSGTIHYWAEISATDDNGVSIRVEEEDVIRIDEISGICAFSERSDLGRLLSIVGTVSNMLSLNATQRITELRKDIDKAKGSKRRDGYGRSVGGDGEYATNEGGIVVFMPGSGGPTYPPALTLDDGCKKQGRLSAYYKAFEETCFFPCIEKSGTREKKALQDGIVRILAFDSAYHDNAGSYEVRITIRRQKTSGTEA